MPFQKGNTYGKGTPKRPEIEQLRIALAAVAKDEGKDLLTHFVERAYKNDKVLTALAKKIVPDLSAIDSKLDLQPQTLIDILAVVGRKQAK